MICYGRRSAHHTSERWVFLLYIERWLKAPIQMPDGTLVAETRGPQRLPGVAVLANLFMYYAFDRWMAREFPGCPFERYADDIVAHCDTGEQAQKLRAAIAERLGTVALELHPGGDQSERRWPRYASSLPSCWPTSGLPGPPPLGSWEPYDRRRSRSGSARAGGGGSLPPLTRKGAAGKVGNPWRDGTRTPPGNRRD